MPSDCCYFVGKAAAAGAAPALNYFGSILHCFAVFTQNLGQTQVRYPSGTLYGYLDVGTQLATYESTAGVNYHGHMVFHKYKSPNSNTWYSLCGNYGFVDLGLSIGSEPSSRPIW